MDANGLNINLADPESIKEQLPEVERIVDAKRKDAESWDALANDLAKIAGVKRAKATTPDRRKRIYVSHQAKPKRERQPSTKDHVVDIVEDSGKPLDVGEVVARLSAYVESPPKRDTVGWSLWKAVQENLLQSVGKGVYAPIDYQADQNDLLVSRNGSAGAEGTDEA